jgi:hypothetical protein
MLGSPTLSRVHRQLRRAGCWAVVGVATLGGFGCNKGKTQSQREKIAQTPKKTSLLEPTRLGEALKTLIDPLPQPVRILTVTALHEQVIVQVQDSKDPTEVIEYRFHAKDKKITGPTQVTLLGSGKLQDNLFPIQAANPQVASEVVTAVTAEYKDQELKKVVMIRNLPRSRDILFRAYIEGNEGLLVVSADKNGRLLGPPEPAPETPE